MRIWELTHCEMNYAVFTPEEKWSIDYIQSFNGSRKSENWIPLFLVLDQPESEHPLNDFPGFQYTSFIIFSSKATGILMPLIQKDAELLPLKFRNDEYYGINVTSVLSCIDYDKSIYKCFKSSGRIMKFYSVAFLKNGVKGHHIFRLTEGPRIYYVSDDFKNMVEKNGLTGFAFKLIWEG